MKDQLPIKELKTHIEKQANHNEALQGLVNVSKALSGSIGKWGDRWEERREERQLNELIPQVPDYLSKIPDEDIYFSRFTFEELVVKQQKLMTELNLLFGAVAVVGAFFTAGGSLYLLAIANGVWGVAQIGVSTMKLRDLNDGVVSDTSFLGINQGMLGVTGLMLGAVDLAILGKTLLKGANRAANNKYMKGIDQISTPRTRVDGIDRVSKEMGLEKLAQKSSLVKETPDIDGFLKNEKELLETIEKKPHEPFEGTGNVGEGGPYVGGSGKIDSTPSTIKYLEDMIKNEGFEYGVIFDSKGNVLSKLVTDNHPTKINFSPYKDQIKDAIVTHNHPTNGMFSWQDFETAIAFDAAEIRAALPNGVTFSMKRGSNGWSVPYNDIRDIFAETQNSFKNNPEIMQIYREEGYAKVNDMLMEAIANKIGGIYSVYK